MRSIARLHVTRLMPHVQRAMEIKPSQCRAARGLLNWTVKTLAENARLGEATITRFETGKAAPNRATLTVIRLAFEKAGIEFLNNDAPGVRMRKKSTP
jgi:transcriptional regulator with XRE-family HTH domain